MTESAKRIDKPWGYEIWWARTDRYVGKLLHINKGESLSLQYHNVKDETIHVLSAEDLVVFQQQHAHGRALHHQAAAEAGALDRAVLATGRAEQSSRLEWCVAGRHVFTSETPAFLPFKPRASRK